MKKMYQIVFLLLITTFCVLSCSKEDENSSINQDGGEVFRSQVVVIELPGVNLNQNEYQALFGGQNITVSKSDEHKLFFLVPYSTTLGMQDLVISSLNDATIHYDVQDTVLSETVDVTMGSFFANLQTFSQNLDGSAEGIDAQNAVDSFNYYYDNATLEDKTEIAILYKANKIMFDKVLQNVDITSRAIDPNALCFGTAVIGIGASLVLLKAPTGATQIAGVVLFGTSAYYAKKCGKPLWNEFVLAEFININGILGTNQRSTFVTFTNDVNSTLSLNTVNRKLISSDASRTESTWVYFFPYFNLLNTGIAKANAVIQVVNDLPFVNFPLIPQIQLPASSPEVSTTVNQEIFSKIQFSVNHSNLQLVSSSLQSDGQLNMKIKIVGASNVQTVESFLKYTYSDDFSKFSGTLPIRVNRKSIIGTWQLESFDGGYLPGQYKDLFRTDCPAIVNFAYTYFNYTYIFNSDNTYSMYYGGRRIDRNISVDSNCNVVGDYQDTVNDYPDVNSAGNYIYISGGNSLEVTDSNGITEVSPFTFISDTKIKIRDLVFVKQQ